MVRSGEVLIKQSIDGKIPAAIYFSLSITLKIGSVTLFVGVNLVTY